MDKRKNNAEIQKWKRFAAGAGIGLANGFFGSGGGILAVAALEHFGLEEKRAHATSILIVLPLSLLSGAIYIFTGGCDLDARALYLLLGGAAGGAAGAFLLGKLRGAVIDAIFTALILYTGIRMLFS